MAKQHEDQWYYVLNPALAIGGKKLDQKGSTRLAQSLMLLVQAASTR